MKTLQTINWFDGARIAYLNWASQTRISRRLANAIQTNQEIFNKISVSPWLGYDLLSEKIEQSRKLIARILNISEVQNIVFARGAVHSLEMLCKSFSKNRIRKIYTTSQEFPAVLRVLENEFNEIIIFPFRQFFESLETIEPCEEECLFVLSQVTYDTGSLLDISNIVRLIRKRFDKAIIVIDGSQAIGNIPIDLSKMDVDAYLFNTNKWLLGTYTGVLVVRQDQLRDSLFSSIQSPFSLSTDCCHEKCSSSGLNLVYTSSLADALPLMLAAMASPVFSSNKLQLKSLLMNGLNAEFSVNYADQDSLASESGIISFNLGNTLTKNLASQWTDFAKTGCHFHVFNNLAPSANQRTPIIRLAVHYFNEQSDIELALHCFKSILHKKQRA